VIAIGQIYKLLKGKSPLERFFNRCHWGNNRFEAGGADWSPTRFENWSGDQGFDHQLEALLNIICAIEISHAHDSFREIHYKMGWIPPQAKLAVKYEETWKDAADSRTLSGDVKMTLKGPQSTSPAFTAYAQGKNGVKLAVTAGHVSKKPSHEKFGKLPLPHKELKKAVASGQLLITFDGTANVTIPHTGWAKKTFHD
jgi:hypothetical protein